MEKRLNSDSCNSLELQQEWNAVVAIYRELPRTENSVNQKARMRRQQLMESLSAKLARIEALILLGRTPGRKMQEVGQTSP